MKGAERSDVFVPDMCSESCFVLMAGFKGVGFTSVSSNKALSGGYLWAIDFASFVL